MFLDQKLAGEKRPTKHAHVEMEFGQAYFIRAGHAAEVSKLVSFRLLSETEADAHISISERRASEREREILKLLTLSIMSVYRRIAKLYTL